ncbi:MAG TPA: amidohydrolase family protein [Ramlibacter sp.]|jgi:aminocarboxymuconate-semialdehyde decarboxylase|nr:amidohydrolase family protein [Ramlibacter sp.]
MRFPWTSSSTHRHGPAGLWFCACNGLPVAPEGGGGSSPKRAPVILKGRRARTVDVHAHCYFQAAIDLMGAEAKSVLPPVKGVPEHFLQQDAVLATRLDAMARMGVDMQVLSINPFWYKQDRETAEAICRIHNESFAEICARHPKRLAAFASLAMQFPDLAVRQLEDAVRRYGLKGAAIGGNVAGRDFAHPEFHPVLAKAQELGVMLFIHPQSTPELAARFKGNGWLANVIGNPLDTTIALQKLIFEGVFDKYPHLKVLGAHGGGFLGSYAPRMDRSCHVSPQNCDPAIQLQKRPTEYIRQIYFDALVFTGEALRHLAAEVGTGQIMMGTDHPIPWEEDPVTHIMGTPELSDEDRLAILGENAIRVLGLAP